MNKKARVVKTKLTLTIDRNIIIKAMGYARQKGRSLSELVENYFKTIVQKSDPASKVELTPAVKSLMGSFKAPKVFDYDYKKILKKKKTEKY
jgi:hypothetical protein